MSKLLLTAGWMLVDGSFIGCVSLFRLQKSQMNTYTKRKVQFTVSLHGQQTQVEIGQL